MEQTNIKKIGIIIVVIIVLAVAAYVIFKYLPSSTPTESGDSGGTLEVDTTEVATSISEELPTPSVLPTPLPENTQKVVDELKNIKVPEKGDEKIIQNQEIAIPEEVAPPLPGSESSIRNFNIKITNNKFSPSQIIVYVNDIVTINFQAVDKDYDIFLESYNIRKNLKKGEVGPVQFQSFGGGGKYNFYCLNCPDPSKSIGQLIVKPR